MSTAAPRTIRWTRDEYYRMADFGLFEGRRVELIRGEIVEMTPQRSAHSTGVTLTCRLFDRAVGDSCVVRCQLPLPIGLDSEPEPDIAIVPGSPRDYAEDHPTSASLVIEVADSSLVHDRRIKASLYADCGIPEYWILNLVDRQLEIHGEPTAGGYVDTTIVPANESVSPLFEPTLRVAVADLLP